MILFQIYLLHLESFSTKFRWIYGSEYLLETQKNVTAAAYLSLSFFFIFLLAA